jgi:ribosome-associated toxin RatA of RatAB toxin-antitoxin module
MVFTTGPPAAAFPLSLPVLLLEFFAIAPLSHAGDAMRTDRNTPTPMPTIRRSALVEHSATRMFALVNDVAAYPRRFDWCDSAQVLEVDDEHMVARLDLGLGALRTWFTTHNTLKAPHHIDLKLVDGPFRKLSGRWEFHALDESACKVTLTLDFEPAVKLLGPAMAVGFQSLADRMVDDFVRIADRPEEMDTAS